MKPVWLIAFLFISQLAVGQPQVLTLGTFHFNFPNLDVQKVAKSDQINVLEDKHQREIADIIQRLSAFKPTILVIERPPASQPKIDSLYQQYLLGHYQPGPAEEEQIGFRIARLFNVKKLYCVDEYGNFTPDMLNIITGKDSIEAKKFETYFEHNPDSSLYFRQARLYNSVGILAALQQLNDEQSIQKSMGNYLIGLFKYESTGSDFKGVDFETGRWFSRNLKIFRNIQRIPATSNDRLLVIYGADHLNLLNYFFQCSPEFRLVKTMDYLK